MEVLKRVVICLLDKVLIRKLILSLAVLSRAEALVAAIATFTV